MLPENIWPMLMFPGRIDQNSASQPRARMLEIPPSWFCSAVRCGAVLGCGCGWWDVSDLRGK